MPFAIKTLLPDHLADYAMIPMTIEVRTVLDLQPINNGLGGLAFHEIPVTPYVKDYDIEGGPLCWPQNFDIQNWGLFLGCENDLPVGGAAVAFNTANIDILEGRSDLAVLWDLRVHPKVRGLGIGTQMFQHAAHWAREHQCAQLKIETQNVNPRACQFYAKQGCQLAHINRYAYCNIPEVAHEIMLIWYLDL